MTTLLCNVVFNDTTKWDGSSREIPYVGLEHIGQDSGNLEGVGNAAEVVSAKNVFNVGDVLFGKLRPNLKKYWQAKFEGICSTDILVLRPLEGILNEYLYYLVQSNPFLSLAMSDAVGTKMPRTSWKRLGGFEFLLPPFSEQERIAEILSNVDDSIRATEAVIEQAGRVKRGLMKDLLTGGLSSEAIACGAAPEGWCTMRLGELTNIAGGTTPKRQIAEYWEDGSVSWATPTDITSMSASIYKLFDTKEKISEAAVSKGGSKIFPEQTVLMTSRATIGYVAVTQVSISTNQGFANFLPNEKYDPQFLCYLLESKRGELIQRASGSTFKEISKSSLKGIQIMLPPLSEQRRIAEILSSVDDQIVANRATADQLRRLKRGLMDDLLTGRVRTVS